MRLWYLPHWREANAHANLRIRAVSPEPSLFAHIEYRSRRRVRRFTARAFRKLLSNYVFSYFPFGFEGRIWVLIVSFPVHCYCLSFYFKVDSYLKKMNFIHTFTPQTFDKV